ncbi:MAG: HEAT repeat domain-containing protein [Candidatus Obscuribacterales bacterium]|nr:HEAT repeat domain-containing protein [Candidatus Obscuribacterales bacterium]
MFLIPVAVSVISTGLCEKARAESSQKTHLSGSTSQAAIAQGQAEEIIAQLADSKSNQLPNLRFTSETKLQVLGPTIAPYLAKQLNSSSSLVAMVCSNVLGKFGSDSIEPIVQELKEHGANQNIHNALRQIGEDAMPPLVKMLQSSKDSERLTAAEVINLMLPTNLRDINFDYPQTNHFVPSRQLVDSICASTASEKSVKVRQLETQILGKIGPRYDVLNALFKIADSDDEPVVRGTAIMAVGAIAAKQSDEAAESYITKLVKWTKSDEFDGCRVAAANAIGLAKKDPGISIPALAALIADPRTEVASAALMNLQKFGSKASSALPSLQTVIEKDADSQQTYYALLAIGHLGTNAKPAVGLLVKDISSSSSQVRSGATSALAQLARDSDINLKPYMPKFLELLKNDDFSTRWQAMQILEAMGTQATSAKDALIASMEKYPNDKGRVQMTLRKILGHFP